MHHSVLPELPGTKPSTKEYTQSYPWLLTHQQQRMVLLDTNGRRGFWLWKDFMPSCIRIPGQGSRGGLIGEEEMAYGISREGRTRKGDNI